MLVAAALDPTARARAPMPVLRVREGVEEQAAVVAYHLHEREKEEGPPFYMRGPWWSPGLPTPLHPPACKVHCPGIYGHLIFHLLH